MPYEMIWEDRGAVARYWDVVTDDELVQWARDLYSHPKFESIAYTLGVFSDSVAFEASSATVKRLAEMDVTGSIRNPNLVVAIVATQGLIRGLTNMYRLQHDAMGGPWNINYFETEEEARRWIAEALG